MILYVVLVWENIWIVAENSRFVILQSGSDKRSILFPFSSSSRLFPLFARHIALGRYKKLSLPKISLIWFVPTVSSPTFLRRTTLTFLNSVPSSNFDSLSSSNFVLPYPFIRVLYYYSILFFCQQDF